MVGSLGFSEAFGLLSVAGVPKELLGPDIQSAVLREARLLLEEAQASCQKLLKANRAKLDRLAERLLERDVISGDELKGLLGARIDEVVEPEFKLPLAAPL
jgi:cell division protease FtsH